MNLRIISWEKVSDDIFKVVAVTSNMSGEKDQDSFQQAIDEALGYGWKVLDNYNKKITKDGNTYVRLVLKVLPLEVEAKDTEAMVNFEPITAKLYRNSTDDSLWTVAKTENGDKLVRNDLPDGEEILEENCNPEMNAEVEQLINPDVYAGDYVSYVNPEGEIKEGFVDNNEDNTVQFVVDLNGDEEEITASAQYLSVVPSTTKVVASYELDGMDPGVTSREIINRYYNDPALMEQIKDLLGDENFINPDEAALALITGECGNKLNASVAVTAGKVLYNVKAEFEKATGEQLDLDIANEADEDIEADSDELVVDVITDNPEALEQAVANCQGDGYELDFEEVESGCGKKVQSAKLEGSDVNFTSIGGGIGTNIDISSDESLNMYIGTFSNGNFRYESKNGLYSYTELRKIEKDIQSELKKAADGLDKAMDKIAKKYKLVRK